MCERLLTESSCVCGLGEIFWHFSVDIESEKKKGEQKREKRVRGGEKNTYALAYVERSTFCTHKAVQYYRMLVEC